MNTMALELTEPLPTSAATVEVAAREEGGQAIDIRTYVDSYNEEVEQLQLMKKPNYMEKAVVDYFEDEPVLAAIAWCESRFRQTDPYGNTLRGKVNESDLGVMQINEYYHGKTAVLMGLNLYALEDNMAYARYLYQQEGTRPWNSSKACWEQAALALQD